jgi:hypothetical protein
MNHGEIINLDITRWDPLVSGNMNVSSAWKIAKVADPFTEVPGFTTAPSGFRLWIEAYRRASANLPDSDDRDQQATAASTNGRIEPF